MKILLTVQGYPTIDISVNDTETGRRYFDLCQKHRNKSMPMFRDSIVYSVEFLQELAVKANEIFGWNWLTDSYDLSITTQLHKDLERLLGTTGFQNIPEQYDSLLYDLHHCLHAIQTGKNQPRTDNFQLEWLTDDCLPLPDDFEFSTHAVAGDLILINPYVGHNPEQIYRENDWSNLTSTCKFHDIIKPAVVLLPYTLEKPLDRQCIVDLFEQKDPDFVALHGREKIEYYTGLPVIGHTNNLEVFDNVYTASHTLVIDQLEFIK
jgi:hypothetical protein